MSQSTINSEYINSSQINELLNVDFDLSKHILWQYDNAPNINALTELKTAWYKKNVVEFWNYINKCFLDILNADDWALNNWAKILRVKRQYNINGQIVTLSKDLFARLLVGKINLLFSNGTVPEINKYINFVFSNHISPNNRLAGYVKDNQNMSVVYDIMFEPTLEELALMYSREFFPTPAGVEEKIYLFNPLTTFGFYGSGLQSFNNAPFWDGRFI